MDRPWLSVVVPAYNEEAAIARTVTSLRDWLDAYGRSYEILVVDNASEDGTLAQLERLVEPGRIRVLENDSNRGKGYSMRRGMQEARGHLRLHCDADCAPCLPALPRMVELSEDYDVVVGSRLVEGSVVGRRQTLPRRIAGRGFVELCRLLLSEPTHDLFCGFKLWRAEAAQQAYGRTRIEGWTFDAEVLAMARALGYEVTETGVTWNDRQGSRLKMHKVLVPVVRELLAARRHVRREAARPSPVGAVVTDSSS